MAPVARAPDQGENTARAEVLCKNKENKEGETCEGVRGVKNRTETPSSIIFFLSCDSEKYFRKITVLLAVTQLLFLYAS